MLSCAGVAGRHRSCGGSFHGTLRDAALRRTLLASRATPMDRAWLTGTTSAEHLRRNRPGYYAELVRAETQERSEEGKRHDARVTTTTTASPANEKFQNEQGE